MDDNERETLLEKYKRMSKTEIEQPNGDSVYAVDPEKAKKEMPELYDAAKILHAALDECIKKSIPPAVTILALCDFVGFTLAKCGAEDRVVDTALNAMKVAYSVHDADFRKRGKKNMN